MATIKSKVQPTIGASTYVDPSQIEWQPSQFEGIQIKVLYVDKAKGEMTCLLKWEPGATLPMHKHPEIEQSFVLEGSFYDHDGICRAGEFVWRHNLERIAFESAETNIVEPNPVSICRNSFTKIVFKGVPKYVGFIFCLGHRKGVGNFFVNLLTGFASFYCGGDYANPI